MKRQRNMFRKKENKTKPQKKELNKYKDRPITSKEIESVIKKPKETKKKQKYSNKQTRRTRWLHRRILSNI